MQFTHDTDLVILHACDELPTTRHWVNHITSNERVLAVYLSTGVENAAVPRIRHFKHRGPRSIGVGLELRRLPTAQPAAFHAKGTASRPGQYPHRFNGFAAPDGRRIIDKPDWRNAVNGA